MPARGDLTGQTFGLWTVTGRPVMQGRRRFWLCKCTCGVEKPVSQDNLVNGRSNSCGCRRDAQARLSICRLHEAGTEHPCYQHGHSAGKGSITYRKWLAAKGRCFNKRNHKYPQYGGRGIAMCTRWKDNFSNFLHDMGECPAGLTLERENFNGNYEPGNCKWATTTEQARNKSSNRLLTYNGGTKLLVDWARHFGVKANKLHYQLSTRGSLQAVIKEFDYANI